MHLTHPSPADDVEHARPWSSWHIACSFDRRAMNPIEQSVADYTSRGPYTVGLGEPLGNARRLMDKYSLDELPVRAEGKVIGLLSARDLRLVWTLMRPPPETLPVEAAMKSTPYTVESSTPLDEVARVMAARHIDAAVVLDRGLVVGVFTASDAMRALADALVTSRGEQRRSPSTATRHSGRNRPSR